MNRFMPCPRKAARESYQHSRFETARVRSGLLVRRNGASGCPSTPDIALRWADVSVGP
jgi:hypothetical protein